jgi:hypothetical protein
VTEQNIIAICTREPMREGEYPDYIRIGNKGVTRIERREENLGSYGIVWFDVFKGQAEVRSASYNALDVASVEYGD